jgi:hypothetical protein
MVLGVFILIFPSGTVIISDINRGLFMVRLHSSLANADFAKEKFVLSPNPAASSVNITSDFGINSIEIFGVLGKKSIQHKARCGLLLLLWM